MKKKGPPILVGTRISCETPLHRIRFLLLSLLVEGVNEIRQLKPNEYLVFDEK
jgi:hypothetical protein